jgi:alkylhydroperoxidase/carboxymuconolactone decarboxylase family protein YurZ
MTIASELNRKRATVKPQHAKAWSDAANGNGHHEEGFEPAESNGTPPVPEPKRQKPAAAASPADVIDSTTSAYEDGERYRNGERVLEETGAAPHALHHWRNLLPEVGPVVDRMLGEFCFGDVWDRPHLDYRTRRIVTITTIATLGRPTLLRTHIRGALAF